MVNASTIRTESELADLLDGCKVPFDDPKNSHAWTKWQDEWNGEPPIARAHGEFFLTVCHNAFEVYVLDPKDFWFVRVDRLKGEVSEQAVIDMIHDVLFRFDWNRQMWRCRRIKWEDTWAYIYERCQLPASDSSELSEILWSLEETNIERFDMAGAQVALRQLFAFLTNPGNLSLAIRCQMREYLHLQSRTWSNWSIRLERCQRALTELFFDDNLQMADLNMEDTHALRHGLAHRLKQIGDTADKELSRLP